MNFGIFPIFYAIFLLDLLKTVASLHCIQCDRQKSWYLPAENERLTQLCQRGEIAPTPCEDRGATHCIYSYFRQGANSHVTVTERKCGRIEDVTGCTLYKSSKRKMRHLLGGSSSDKTVNSHRRRETALFVEVCTTGCEGDACINSSVVRFFHFSLLASCIFAFFAKK